MKFINGVCNTIGPIFTGVAGAAITWPYYSFQAAHAQYAEWSAQGLNPADEVSQVALVAGSVVAVATILLGPVIAPVIGHTMMSDKTNPGMKAGVIAVALALGIVAGGCANYNYGPLANHDMGCSVTMIGKTTIASCSAKPSTPQPH